MPLPRRHAQARQIQPTVLGVAPGARAWLEDAANRPQAFDQLSHLVEPPRMRMTEHVLSDWLAPS
jgi:hypothetical protein